MWKIFVSIASVIVVVTLALISTHFYLGRDIEESYNFGVVAGSPSVEHVFRVPNFAPGKLRIEQVQSSCGCTVVEKLPEVVGPFSVLQVPVRMDVSQKSGPASSEVILAFEGGRTAKFRLEATVYQELPERVNLGRFKRGETVERTYLDTDGQFNPSRCQFGPITGIAVEPRIVSGFPIVTISVTPEFNLSNEYSLPLQIQCVQREDVFHTIEGYVEGLVEAERELVSLGYIKASEPSAGHAVAFRSPYGKSFRWDEASTKPPSWLLLSRSKENSDSITVHLRPPLPPGLLSETVNIHFDVADAGQVIVPVTIHAYVTSDAI